MWAIRTGATPTARTNPAARCRAVPPQTSGTAGSTPKWSSAAAVWGRRPEDQRPGPAAMSSEDRTRLRAAEAAWMVPLDLRRGSRAQFDALLDSWEPLSRSGQCPADPLAQGFLRASLRVPSWRDAVLVMAAAGRTAACAGADHFGIFDSACRLAPVRPRASGVQDTGSGPGPVLPDEVPCRGVRSARIRRGPAGPGAARAGLDQHEQPGRRPGAAGSRWRAGCRGGAARGAGWISWCRGTGSYAAAHLGQALDEEPGYRLAELLLELVRRGTLCGWAARKEAAWQKFGPDAA